MTFFKNLKVRAKFSVLVVFSLLAILFIGLYAYLQSNEMAKDMEIIYEEKFIPNTWISDAAQANLRIDSILIEMMFIDDLATKQSLHAELNEGVDEVLSNFAVYENMELSETERAEIGKFYEAVDALTGKQDEMINLALAGNNEAAYALFQSDVQAARENLVNALYNLNDIKTEQTAEISDKNVTAAGNTGKTVIYILLIVTVVLSILGVLFARAITVPVRDLLVNIGNAGNGDFTSRSTYESKDELGQVLHSFNDMMANLQIALKNVQKSATEVDDNASNLSANIQQSGATTEHVVSAVQEIAAGSEETKRALEKNSFILNDVTTKVAEIQRELGNIEVIAGESVKTAKDGASTVSENVVQMEKIQESINESNRVIDALSNQVGEVDNILQVINSISEQTNLLALNAAIEAARAGEHGKGFAVVADEVRKLAEQSLTSTNSIAQILNNIKQDTEKTVHNMSVVLTETNKGLASTHSSAEKFNDIYVGTSNVAPLLSQMVETVKQMNANLDNFVQHADAILQIAISNAANSEEVSASAEQQMNATVYMQESAEALANVASDLNDVLKQFKI
jgi:methyl-accepting chemotaxis protein